VNGSTVALLIMVINPLPNQQQLLCKVKKENKKNMDQHMDKLYGKYVLLVSKNF